MPPEQLEFGLDTFGDVTEDTGGRRLAGAEVIRNLVEQAVLADKVGVDAFGIGEQLLAGAHPAVHGHPVNVQRAGQGLHVDAVARLKGPAGQAEGIERDRPGDRSARRLGFIESDYITASYYGLYVEYCRRNGLTPADMVFKDPLN